MKFGNLKAALIAASALMAVPALAQSTHGGSGVNGPSGSITNGPTASSNATVFIGCKNKLTGEFARENCTEKQLPFMGDKNTRKLTIEQIGYLAMGHILEAERNFRAGYLDRHTVTYVANNARKEAERIARSRKTALPTFQADKLNLDIR